MANRLATLAAIQIGVQRRALVRVEFAMRVGNDVRPRRPRRGLDQEPRVDDRAVDPRRLEPTLRAGPGGNQGRPDD
jgi:hypothetical protein